MKGQQFPQAAVTPGAGYGERIEIGRLRMGAAEYRARAGRRTFEQRRPFLAQRFRLERTQPVHVVQQHEFRYAGPHALQQFGDGAAVVGDAVGEAVFQREEIVALQVFRAAVAGIGAAYIDPPEIIAPQGQAAEYVFDGVAHESRYAPSVLLAYFLMLGCGHAEHAHGDLPRQRPVHAGAPHAWRDPRVVDVTLLVQRFRVDQFIHRRTQLRLQIDVVTEQRGHTSRQAVEIEGITRIAAVEPRPGAIPELLCERRQVLAQGIAVNFVKTGVTPFAEHCEEIVELKAPDAGKFQLKQGGLPRVGVNGMDMPWSGEGIVERVAAGTGDDQDGVVAADIQRQTIHRRIFPAGVVDQRTGIKCIKNALINAICECFDQSI